MSEQPGSPRARAAALQYEQGERAPRLVAKGQGLVAQQILDLAREHGIPVHQDPALVEALSRLEVEQAIPPELYAVVAALIAFIYRLDRESGRTPR
jgi:flagellar biosynthesis protein